MSQLLFSLIWSVMTVQFVTCSSRFRQIERLIEIEDPFRDIPVCVDFYRNTEDFCPYEQTIEQIKQDWRVIRDIRKPTHIEFKEKEDESGTLKVVEIEYFIDDQLIKTEEFIVKKQHFEKWRLAVTDTLSTRGSVSHNDDLSWKWIRDSYDIVEYVDFCEDSRMLRQSIADLDGYWRIISYHGRETMKIELRAWQSEDFEGHSMVTVDMSLYSSGCHEKPKIRQERRIMKKAHFSKWSAVAQDALEVHGEVLKNDHGDWDWVRGHRQPCSQDAAGAVQAASQGGEDYEDAADMSETLFPEYIDDDIYVDVNGIIQYGSEHDFHVQPGI